MPWWKRPGTLRVSPSENWNINPPISVSRWSVQRRLLFSFLCSFLCDFAFVLRRENCVISMTPSAIEMNIEHVAGRPLIMVNHFLPLVMVTSQVRILSMMKLMLLGILQRYRLIPGKPRRAALEVVLIKNDNLLAICGYLLPEGGGVRAELVFPVSYP